MNSGAKRTGKPCRRGHFEAGADGSKLCVRYVSNGGCVKCAAEDTAKRRLEERQRAEAVSDTADSYGGTD